MRRIVLLAMVIVMVSGVAFASGPEDPTCPRPRPVPSVKNVNVNNNNNTNRNVFEPTVNNEFNPKNFVKAYGGEGGEAYAEGGNARSNSRAKSNSASSISQNISYDEPIQGVPFSPPSHLWMVPREKFLWNQLGFDPRLLEGKWTTAKAKRVAKSVTGLFKPNVKVVSTTFAEHKKTKTLTFSLGGPPSGYEFFGAVNATGGKKALEFGAIGKSVVKALADGADFVVLKNGLNTVNSGSSLALGAVPVFSDNNSSATVSGGIGSASTKQLGEPGVILALYKRKASADMPGEAEPVVLNIGVALQIADYWLDS